ncbi:outer membrane lipoprotein-sorting protein [Duganella sp. FT3S]|uniref:Outer membrane lipoprotein-sorting protein n=1 Tax=Rugamonas fusca TaxID=2758568 RepID=A0A7W2EFT9_9BURK|nr:outer membrane lipoprotein-sorting protein [Rugamonas fusca]MBA5605176.1 outer membrane lipoprotein-sorting protein [Rugamonas fusca]
MMRGALRCLLLAGVLAASPAFSATPSAQEILRQVDHYRLPLDSFEAAVRIVPVQGGKEQEPGTYVVRGANRNQALVEATSVDQRGEKFLTTDGGIFFYAPRTRRAIRLTPLQTLRGKASIGDLARISFANDYDATLAETPPGCAADCLALDLRSRNEAATYTRITLLVGRQHGQYVPLKAMLHVASGKLLKVAVFDAASGGLPPTTRYLDPQLPDDETRVVYEKIRSVAFPANTFNPRSLEQ